MKLYKNYPVPSDRMGLLWTLSGIKDLVLVEFGPEGTTRYLLESLKYFGEEANAKIFTTMMDEDVVIMGNAERLRKTLVEVDEMYSPEYIFVVESSVGAVIGMDIEGLCREFQQSVKAKLLSVKGGGLSGIWTTGVEEALSMLAEIAEEKISEKENYNILGCCADELNHKAEADAITAMMEKAFALKVNCILSASASIEDCKKMGKSALNVVLRKEALPAAQTLEKKFGTPYVYGRPYGLDGTQSWLEEMEEKLGREGNWKAVNVEMEALRSLILQLKQKIEHGAVRKLVISGHSETVKGLTAFASLELGLPVLYLKSAWSAPKEEAAVTEEEYRHLLEESGTFVLVDGLHSRLADEKRRIQTAHPILEGITVPQPGLMGIKGAAYIVRKLIDL
ncbi:nitrogenase component 1 [Sinanaerobacter sp. ZZT-01]|uniref:nitrogenase component 1 n=1 Tax=Sinanaerobacter sp. ZZT-01 TaxID=3111540 RepID=UPI002D77217E|nr:nitrogenase component 1 [Sinanaerobacter sp. ZZT-01]WRR92989.1 nitrogenase component 1 [Sinanaerobacter sp. ZZT-01]